MSSSTRLKAAKERQMVQVAVEVTDETLTHRQAMAAGSISYLSIVDDICCLPWEKIDSSEILQVAHAYYYFSIQFRENLEIALQLYPNDSNLQQLYLEECDTDNLSPWPKIAYIGEKLNHDEFMRRLLALQPLADTDRVTAAGSRYLEFTRQVDARSRALSIVSYEDGGLSRIFGAILRATDWTGEAQQAFRHFLEKHLLFDSDSDEGHGALCRHFAPDNRVAPLWQAFKDILLAVVPTLTTTRPFPHLDEPPEEPFRAQISPPAP
jgi:hypothetical protein